MITKTIIIFFIACIFGCASSTVKSRANSSQDFSNKEEKPVRTAVSTSTTEEFKDYKAIETEYRNKQYETAIYLAQQFSKKHSSSSMLDQVLNLSSLSNLALKKYPKTIEELQTIIDITQNSSLKTMATYNLAFTYFEIGKIDQAYDTLSSIKPSALFSEEASNQVKIYILKAKISRLKQDFSSSSKDILNAIQHTPQNISSRESLEPMLVFLEEVLLPITNIEIIENLLQEFEESIAADRLYFKIGEDYFSKGERDHAKKYFEKIINKFPNSRLYPSARDYVQRVDFQRIVDPKRIGVVLTLSGKYGSFGQKALQGIELALKVFKSTKSIAKDGLTNSAAPISLVVIDDRGDTERAHSAMEELVYKHHVVAVIGPLLSKLAEPMSKKAQELGVPLIALTQKEVEGGEYIFNAGLTPAIQTRELLRYVNEKMGIKKFAILAPKSKFGEEYVKAFWDEIDRTKGVIKGYELYLPNETDFRLHVDKLSGLADPQARAKEMEELRILKAATPIKSRSKKFDRLFELKPIVDYQAVFIPDEPRMLGQILPTFAYRDVEHMLFLGINTWHGPELISRVGHFAEGSVFVDGFYLNSSKPSVQKFIEDYESTFGNKPSIVEALAYDAGQILSHLILSKGAESRSDIKKMINNLKDFPGVTGSVSYISGKLTKSLHVLTVKSGKFEEIAFP